MAQHNNTGKLGEQKATEYLQRFGYTILEHNWRCGHLELDIIAQWEDTVAFVEVKTRQQEGEFTALGAVTQAKCRACVYAANAYLEQHPDIKSVRFDVITVVGSSPENFVVRHYEDAFNPFQLLRRDQLRFRNGYG